MSSGIDLDIIQNNIFGKAHFDTDEDKHTVWLYIVTMLSYWKYDVDQYRLDAMIYKFRKEMMDTVGSRSFSTFLIRPGQTPGNYKVSWDLSESTKVQYCLYRYLSNLGIENQFCLRIKPKRTVLSGDYYIPLNRNEKDQYFSLFLQLYRLGDDSKSYTPDDTRNLWADITEKIVWCFVPGQAPTTTDNNPILITIDRDHTKWIDVLQNYQIDLKTPFQLQFKQ